MPYPLPLAAHSIHRSVPEFPFPLPGLGIDMVWNPRLADQYFVEWLRALLFDAATHL
ncbi:hypothetical protein [Streptomyces sp. NPDC005262]|uniref:hypothetical protein n=1 Tax=Streptomyces sp. NPDC005262 TaxID=3364710 RepID=UPI0036AA0CB0